MSPATHPDATWSRCTACGTGAYPPQRRCTACGSWDASRADPLPVGGRLFAWTVIHVAAPEPPLPVPYAVGYVDLDEGPRVLAPIAVDGDPEARLAHGLRVRLVAHDDGEPVPFHCEVLA